MDEEDIDNETLQATVNASLARINDLVSSWVKPPKNLPPSNSKDVEKEIERLLRLPPRLGVGAQPPESTSVSGREAVRLKGRLVGKKRQRDDDEGPNKAPSDDEDESRAGAIQKKPKLDPFGGGGKKKKQKQKGPYDAQKVTSELGLSTVNLGSGKNAADCGLDSSPQKPHKVKDGVEVSVPDDQIETIFGKGPALPTNSSSSSDDGEETVEKSTSASSARPIIFPDINRILNLTGPPTVSAESSNQSSKKKRKKRKKKKNKANQQHVQ